MMSDQQEVPQDNRQATAILPVHQKSGNLGRILKVNTDKISEFGGGKYTSLESGDLLAQP